MCLTQTERVSDDVTRKIGRLDFIDCWPKIYPVFVSLTWKVENQYYHNLQKLQNWLIRQLALCNQNQGQNYCEKETTEEAIQGIVLNTLGIAR